MIEKHKLLDKIDDAIKDKSTSPKNKELLKELKGELVSAKSKKEYSDIALKIIQIIGAIVKIFSGSG